ncbi:MAG TPA: hypothetical protein VKA92_04335 [Segetibacter sp.]|nr:hypothetical protein [Segetibacter sp.]
MGTKVVIALMKTTTPVGATTGRKIYNMTGNEVNKYWLALVFRGKAGPPIFFNSLNEVQTFVLQTPSAIGVITPGTGTTNRVINIDAKKSI